MANVVSLADYRKQVAVACSVQQRHKDALSGMRECLKFFRLEEGHESLMPALRSLVLGNYLRIKIRWRSYPLEASAGDRSPIAKVYLWATSGVPKPQTYLSLEVFSSAMGQAISETMSGLPTWLITSEAPFIEAVETAWPSLTTVTGKALAEINLRFSE